MVGSRYGQSNKLLDRTAVRTRDEALAKLRAQESSIRQLGATGLFMFGSAARDELSRESDIDVFVDYERNGSFDYYKLCDLQRLLAAILGRDVDLLTRHSLHPLLRGQIEMSAVRVF